MKHSRLLMVALVLVMVVGSTRRTEAKFYTAYISDGPDTSIAYWLAKEVGLFMKHGLDMELIFIDGSSRGVQSLIAGDLSFTDAVGTSSISPDLSGKRLELLKDAVPKVSRVGVLWYPGRDEDEVKQTEIAGRAFGIAIQSVQVQSVKEFDSAYAAMKRERANGIILIQGGFTLFHRKQLAELAARNRLPSMCEQSTWTDDGCLMSYGPSQADRMRRAAVYVDKILKGAKPADLPVEQPSKFEMVINLKTAKRIGLIVPQKVLARADKVIR